MLEIKIGFICDAGVGSSAMGAALFRRKIKEEGMDGITAEAYAVDQIPDDRRLPERVLGNPAERK